ncbi:MAG TPA: hypothetical protein VNZ05_06145, partial [Solirubrobacteraceae bacterium]|nr:hypothetical protein [Solirubrobacteraceae bacterium]
MKLARAPYLLVLLACALGGCGAGTPTGTGLHSGASTSVARATSAPAAPTAKPVSRAPVVSAPGRAGPQWKVLATIAGQPAAWISERSAVTLMRFDQALVRLALHAGSAEPGGGGWTYGSEIGPR